MRFSSLYAIGLVSYFFASSSDGRRLQTSVVPERSSTLAERRSADLPSSPKQLLASLLVNSATARAFKYPCAALHSITHASRATRPLCCAPVVEDTKTPYFITTPIYYVNGQPHIGHAYTTLACDVIARFKRLDGHDVIFLTGTDEHGQKVQQSAEAAGETPLAFADRVSDTFRALLPLYNFTCDQFIRTTEERHIEAAQALWRKLVEAGDIYLGEYEGWYSVRDEMFVTEDELVDGKAPSGAPVEWMKEPSYFFRLTRWMEKLEAYIVENEDFIAPVSRRNEVLSFIRNGDFKDLSISRTTFTWGVPVPDQTEDSELNHIMYVWLDALTNYISALGYPSTAEAPFTTHWPANLHIVGKDILRFHAIYWPAFLMAAGLPLPKRLFAHGWWTVNGEKMSKSLGNVIDPTGLVHQYGCDQVRTFMVSEVPFGNDGDFSHTRMVNFVNARLSNELGNLAFRTLSLAVKYCDSAVPVPGELKDEDEAMLAASRKLLPDMREFIDEQLLHRAAEAVSLVVQEMNRYISEQEPWSLSKTDPERMRTVLWVLMEALRYAAILYQPIIPGIASKLLDQLGVPEDRRDVAALAAGKELVGGTPIPKPEIVIPRIETEEEKLDKAAAEAKKAKEKEEAKKLEAAKLAAKAERAKIPPSEMFDPKYDELFGRKGSYGTCDEEGIPLTNADGEELSKSQRKKFKKQLTAQEKAYSAWVKATE